MCACRDTYVRSRQVGRIRVRRGRISGKSRGIRTGIPDAELARRRGRLSALLNVVCEFVGDK